MWGGKLAQQLKITAKQAVPHAGVQTPMRAATAAAAALAAAGALHGGWLKEATGIKSYQGAVKVARGK